jgi:hypothetical protein
MIDVEQVPPVRTRHTGVKGSTRIHRIFIGVTAAGVSLGIGGFVVVGLDIALPNIHLAVYAAACFVLAGLAGVLLVLRVMLADCEEFYRRGHLDGWMRGWNGQSPAADDSLLK